MKTIYLDTNFLLIPAQFKVDIYSELERIIDFPHKVTILDKSLDEIRKIIREQKGKNKDAAKLALQLIEHKIKQKSLNITTFSKDLNVDDILVELANKEVIVATQDKELKKRVEEKGGRIITLRDKKYLSFT